jgi:hypothetical protein
VQADTRGDQLATGDEQGLGQGDQGRRQEHRQRFPRPRSGLPEGHGPDPRGCQGDHQGQGLRHARNSPIYKLKTARAESDLLVDPRREPQPNADSVPQVAVAAAGEAVPVDDHQGAFNAASVAFVDEE